MKNRIFVLSAFCAMTLVLNGCNILGISEKEKATTEISSIPYEEMGTLILKDMNGADLGAIYGKTVTDESFESWLQTYMESYAIPKDDVSSDGDVVTFSLKASHNGKEIPIYSFEGYTVRIGTDSIGMPELEDNLKGMKKDDTKTFTSNVFSGEYNENDEPVMVDADMVLTVNEVRYVPELDDEFVKMHSSLSTVDEFRADQRKQLIERTQAENEVTVYTSIFQYLKDRSSFDVSDKLIDAEKERIMATDHKNAEENGQSFEDYIAPNTGFNDMDRYKINTYTSAITNAEQDLLFKHLDKAESVFNDDAKDFYVKLMNRTYNTPELTADDYLESMGEELFWREVMIQAIGKKYKDVVTYELIDREGNQISMDSAEVVDSDEAANS